MKRDKDTKVDWIIDPLINPKDNWELYQLLMEKDKHRKIETEYTFKKNKTPKK
jgi:hypothetical protein